LHKVSRDIVIGFFLIFIYLIFLTPGCKDDTLTGPDGSPSTVMFPDSAVSYSAQVQVLFNQTCVFSGCHGGSLPQGRVRLEAYGDWFSTPGVVVPFNPGQSELVTRVEGNGVLRMPLNRNSLNQNQINGIKRWIQEGAANN